MTVMYRKVSIVASLMLTVSGLSACSLFGGEDVKVRPIETMSGLTSSPRDAFYESAVTAINARDYGRALDYLQAAKARDPRNVKALNALGVVYDKLGRFDLSARYYAQARGVEPESRVVAENVGYSAILQNLLRPGRQTAVATNMLPADLNNASPEQPPIVIAASPATVIPNVMPREKLAGTQFALSTPLIPAVPPLDKPKPAVVIAAIVPLGKNMVEAPPVIASEFPSVVDLAGIPRQRHVAAKLVFPVAAMPVRSRSVIRPSTQREVFVIGHPVKILDASGKRDRAGVVWRRLGMLGWTVRPSDARRIQLVTTLFYPKQNDFAAKAMQRTLPFPVRLVDGGSRSAMTLVIGQDYLSWKPRNARLAALWQKNTTVASLQPSSTKGIRQ